MAMQDNDMSEHIQPAKTAERRNARTRKREAALLVAAQAAGFTSKSAMLTAIINGSYIVVPAKLYNHSERSEDLSAFSVE